LKPAEGALRLHGGRDHQARILAEDGQPVIEIRVIGARPDADPPAGARRPNL